MSDTPPKFLRTRLFFMFGFMAFYAIFYPKLGYQFFLDFRDAEHKRRVSGAKERIFRRRKKATCPGELG